MQAECSHRTLHLMGTTSQPLWTGVGSLHTFLRYCATFYAARGSISCRESLPPQRSQDTGAGGPSSAVQSAPVTAVGRSPLRHGLQVATARAFDLPPVQQDLSFLRLTCVLAELCHQAYASGRAAVPDVVNIQVPQAGPLSPPARVAAKLLHFRCAQRASVL